MKICAKLWSESMEGRDHLEDLGVDGRIVFKQMFGKEDGRVWIDLDGNRNWLQAVVNMVMNLRVP
jgi:hypothetical protein